MTLGRDAFFAGTSGGDPFLIATGLPIGLRVNHPASRFAAGVATIIAAAEGHQLANWYPEQRHGLLTYFLLKGLQGSADADRDGSVSVG